jgi:hypothetical protein
MPKTLSKPSFLLKMRFMPFTSITFLLDYFSSFFSPFSPSILDVKFSAFTKKYRKVPKILDINDPYTIVDAGISPTHPIYFVTHGFLEFGGAPWIRKMREELLINNKHSSVIVIDWKGGSSPPYYQAVANIRLVGAIVAHMIFTIFEELKLRNLDDFHLIGHSLGMNLW